MNLSLGINLGSTRGGSSEPSSFITSADFTETNAAYSDILGPLEVRAARDVSGNGRLEALVPAGNYIVTGVIAAYDGAIPGITQLRLSVQDNATQRVLISTAGAWSTGIISIASGKLSFALTSAGQGYRTTFFVEAA